MLKISSVNINLTAFHLHETLASYFKETSNKYTINTWNIKKIRHKRFVGRAVLEWFVRTWQVSDVCDFPRLLFMRPQRFRSFAVPKQFKNISHIFTRRNSFRACFVCDASGEEKGLIVFFSRLRLRLTSLERLLDRLAVW